jgi:hypothetical protein
MCSPQSARSRRTDAAGLLAVLAVGAALVGAQAPPSAPAGASFDVRHYAVELTLDLEAGAMTGTERIDLSVREATQAYTTFATSHWMVAVDAPADRATLDVAVTMPPGWKAAGSGREVEHGVRGGGTVSRWRL